jgi:hypothetical protein
MGRQLFPLYWLGLGTRSALLPANLASVEIAHSWWHLATYGVLSAWAVAGLMVAPILLRWVAWRESGSSVAAPREGPAAGSRVRAARLAAYFEVVFSTEPFPRIGSAGMSAS